MIGAASFLALLLSGADSQDHSSPGRVSEPAPIAKTTVTRFQSEFALELVRLDADGVRRVTELRRGPSGYELPDPLPPDCAIEVWMDGGAIATESLRKLLGELRACGVTGLSLPYTGLVTDEQLNLLGRQNLRWVCASGEHMSSIQDHWKISGAGLLGLASPEHLRVLELRDFPELSDNAIAALIAKCPALEHVDLGGCSLVGAKTLEALSRIPRLRVVRMTSFWNEMNGFGDADLAPVLARCDLNVLAIAWNKRITDKGLQGLERQTHLGVLELENISKLWAPTVQRIAKLPALTKLELKSCDGWLGDGLGDLTTVQRLSLESAEIGKHALMQLGKLQLEALDLTYVRATDDEVLEQVAHSTALRELGFSHCESITGKGVLSIARCRSLRVLDLSECPLVDEAALKTVAALPELRVLTVTNNKSMTDAVARVLGESTTLEELDLYGCWKLHDDALRSLARVKTLRSLSLTGCNPLTDAGIAELRRALPDCRVIE